MALEAVKGESLSQWLEREALPPVRHSHPTSHPVE
jgi:hypothetical protein